MTADTLTITHTHEGGTLIRGTARGDGSAEVLKVNRWRWGRSIGTWYVPNSRDSLPKTLQIDATRDALTAVGFTVELDISTEARDWAEVEAGKIERQAARIDALSATVGRKEAAESAADARVRSALDSLPWGGEPIKVGHHSEGRHRNAIAKADTAMRRSIEAGRETEAARAKADVAAYTTDARYEPGRVARRIEGLEVEARKLTRSLTNSRERADEYAATHDAESVERYAAHAERLQLLSDQNADQIAYWRSVRAAQIAEGKAGDYSPETIAKGDLVAYRFADAAIVTRVNPKTVTIAYWPRWEHGRMSSDSVAYGDLTKHTVPTDDQRAELLAKAKKAAAENKASHAAALASFR